MPSNSVLRRYTPPTCTLEISAKDSPLSRWVGQSVLKHLRFKLSFDDPRVSEEHWITVRGDRAQLEALSEVVTTYVQQFLNQSSAVLKETRAETSLPQISSVASASGEHSSSSVLAPASDLRNSSDSEVSSKGILIQPKSILSHELLLGTLATEDSGESIRLSAVQLADLAAALDEYAADVTALPNLNRSSWLKNPPQWTSIAATFLIAVGLTTSALRLLDRSTPTSADAPTTSQGASSSDQRLALQPLPNSPTPLPIVPATPPPLSTIPNLPSLSADSSSPSGGALPKVSVPPSQPTPPKIKIVEPPEGSVLVNPVPSQIDSNTRAQEPVPPASIARTQARRAPADSSAKVESNQEASTAPSKESTAFDTIPQVAEIRQYFKQRWKPPTGLTGKLEYQLVLNPDGSLNQKIPLNQAAGDFVDRPEVGMPLDGDPFVSAVKGKRTVIIRVVLDQDGTVQTFNETGL